MRRVLTGISIAMLVLVLSTVTGVAKESITYFAGPHGTTVLNLITEFAKEFEQETGIHVDVQSDPSADNVDKITSMIAGGTPPDVVHLTNGAAITLANKGLLLNLRPYLDRDGIDLDQLFVPPVLDWMDWGNGAIYVMPLSAQPFGIYYNPDHFQEAGIADPHALAEENNWTWGSALEAMKKLTRRRDDGTLARAGIWANSGFARWQVLVWQAGGSIFNRRIFPTQAKFDSPKVRTALEWYRNLWTEYHVTPTASDLSAQGGNWWREGLASMYTFTGPYEISDLREANVTFNWDLAPMWKGPESDVTWLSTHNMQILDDAPNKEAAWRFLKYVAFRTDAMERYSVETGRPPALRQAFQAYIDEAGSPPQHVGVLIKSLGNARTTIVSPYLSEISRTANAVVREGVITGKRSVKDALIEIEQKVNAILSK